MYTETVKILERQLKDEALKNEFTFNSENMQLAYKIICRAEGIKPGKIFFFNPGKHPSKYRHLKKYLNEFDGGVCLEIKKNVLFFKIKKYRLFIEKDYKWPIYLLHELTHQILMKEMKYSSHGKLFKKLFEALADKYFQILVSITTSEIKK